MESNSTDSNMSKSDDETSRETTPCISANMDIGATGQSTDLENEAESYLAASTSSSHSEPVNVLACDPSTKIGRLLNSFRLNDEDKEIGAIGIEHTSEPSSDSDNSESSDEEMPESLESEPKTPQLLQDTLDNEDSRVEDIALSECDPDMACKICGEPYQDPRILPCLHSFCCQCIKKRKVVVSKERGSSVISCPVCKEKAEVNPEEECSFNFNPFLANHVKLGQAIKSEMQCVMCKIRGENNSASGLCLDCKDVLCQDCCEKHTYSRVTVNHKIVSAEELSKGKYNSDLVNRQEVMCPVHAHEELKFYCGDCTIAVCRDCIILHHQNHTCQTSQQAAEKTQTELKNLLIGIKQKQEILFNDDIHKYSDQMEQIDSLQEAEMEKITAFTEHLIDLLNKEKEIYQKRMKHEFSSMRNRCCMRKSDAERNVRRMKELCDFTDKLLKDGKPEEIISLADIIRHRAVSALNTCITHEPVAWFNPPHAHVVKMNPTSMSEARFPIFKIMPAKKKFDPINDMKFETTYKEWLKFKGLNVIKRDSSDTERGDNQVQSVTEGSGSVSAVGGSVIETDKNLPITNSGNSVNKAEEVTAPVGKGAKPKKKKNGISSEAVQALDRDSPSSVKLYDDVASGKRKKKKNKVAKTRIKATDENRTLITMNPNDLSYYHGAPVVMYSNGTQTNYVASSQGNVKNKNKTAKGNYGQQNMVSVQYLYAVDTRLKGEREIPNLTAIIAKNNNQVYVCDSNNNKIKIFNKQGHLQDEIATVRPTSVAFINQNICWCSENTIQFQPTDKSYTSKLNFHSTGVIPHPVSWHTSNDVIVGNGNHLRRYKVDAENKNLKKVDIITPTDMYGNPLCNIFNVRAHKDGRMVSVDWNIKAVVISGPDGNCTGQYFDGYMDSWLPGGVCFDALQGHVFVTDYNGDRLLLLHGITGHLLQEWTVSPTLSRPWGIACNKSGHLFLTGNDPYVHVFRYSYSK